MAEKGGGMVEEMEEGGLAMRTSIGRPVLSVTVSCVIITEEIVAVVRELVEEGEDMDKSWLLRGVELGDGLRSWNASVVIRRQRGNSRLSSSMLRIGCREEIAE